MNLTSATSCRVIVETGPSCSRRKLLSSAGDVSWSGLSESVFARETAIWTIRDRVCIPSTSGPFAAVWGCSVGVSVVGALFSSLAGNLLGWPQRMTVAAVGRACSVRMAEHRPRAQRLPVTPIAMLGKHRTVRAQREFGWIGACILKILVATPRTTVKPRT